MGDFLVHHVRFYEYSPQAIQCLAYNKEWRKLALSRSDGSIELWSEAAQWYQEEIIPGCEGKSIEGLVWQGRRLFTAGLDGNITEVNLVTLQIKNICSSNAGPVWCLTSNFSGTKLAAGTEDGCVIILDTQDGQLMYSNRFTPQESRILCISWHASEDVIVTGGIDNIRLWSTKSGQAIQRLTLGRKDKNKETVVWCVQILSDMTVVSGDSRGKTTFWNGKQGTVIKSIQSHQADVFCLAVNDSESTVLSSGVSADVMQFNFMAARENSDWRDWVCSFVHHQHSHDVRALQVVGNTVISGGVDTNMIHFVFKKDRMDGSNVWKRIRAIPHRSMVQVAREKNIMLLKYPTHLEVWRLGFTDRTTGASGDILPLRSNPVKLIQLKVKEGSSVFCCDISQDASVIAYSDCATIRCYKVNIDNLQSIQPSVNMRRVPAKGDNSPEGAHCMCLTTKGDKLITVTSSSRLQISHVSSDDVRVEHTFPQKSDCVHLLCTSPDDRLAAVADHNCTIHLYDICKYQFLCTVPRVNSQVTAMSFSPNSQLLVLAHADQRICEFAVTQREYSAWTKSNLQRFPPAWLRRRSKITHIEYNPQSPSQLVMNDEQMLCVLDKTQPFPKKVFQWTEFCKMNPNAPTAFHICDNYKYLLHVEMLPGNWMVVVERPHLEFYGQLPNALKKKTFGT